MEDKQQHNITSWLAKAKGWLSYQKLVHHMPFMLFGFALTVFYIHNTHTTEGTIRKIDKMKNEMKEVRWEYMSEKSDLMYKSKQTEIADAVDYMGLKEITEPPKKIVISESEY